MMIKSDVKFINEIKEMIESKQYNEEAFNKLINLIAISKLLAEKEKNDETAKILNRISIIGETLAKKLYVLKKQQQDLKN